jgi:hypothetical protein
VERNIHEHSSIKDISAIKDIFVNNRYFLIDKNPDSAPYSLPRFNATGNAAYGKLSHSPRDLAKTRTL